MDIQDQDNFVAAPLQQPLEQSVIVVPDETSCIDVARKVAERNRNKEDWDESFFVCDLGWIVDQYKRWKRELPGVDVYYAVKSNSLQPVISTLAALGCGYDCASKAEIAMVLKYKVSGDRIIFSHPCKFTSHILFAKDKGVSKMAFDTEEEIYKLKKHYPEARLVLRIETSDDEARVKFGKKFGAPVDYAKVLVQKAKELNMNVIGVSFHVGSGCPGLESFARAIENSRKIFDFASEIGYKFNFLDIGGGFPGTKCDESVRSFEDTANAVCNSLEKNFPPDSGVQIIAEPGRYFPGAAYALSTNVIGKKVTEDLVSYHVGDGIYNSFTHVLIENSSFQPMPLQKQGTEKPRPTIIYGASCDGGDVINTMTTMPEVGMSEWIFWQEMGSYSAYTRFGFNGFTTHKACHFISAAKMAELKELCAFPSLIPKTQNNI